MILTLQAVICTSHSTSVTCTSHSVLAISNGCLSHMLQQLTCLLKRGIEIRHCNSVAVLPRALSAQQYDDDYGDFVAVVF